MELRTAIEFIEAAGAVVATTRLLGVGSAGRFPALFSYLVFLAVLNIDLGLLAYESNAYFYNYFFLEILKCALSVVAVRELVSLIFEDYPGIGTVGRWVICAAVPVCLGVSVLVAFFFWNGGPRGRSTVFYLEISQRSVFFTLAVVIIALLFTLSRYPLRLPRNTVISCVSFSALLLSDAFRLLIDGLAAPPYLYNRYVDWSESVFSGVCMVAWAVLLSARDDTVPARITFLNPREEHLLQELAALNQVLARVARR
jgi:hypothetical protein